MIFWTLIRNYVATSYLFFFFLGGTKNETIFRDEMNGSSDDVSLQGLTNGCNVHEGLSGFADQFAFCS